MEPEQKEKKMATPNHCPTHNDIFISYNITDNVFYCIKCVIELTEAMTKAQRTDKPDIRSFHEMTSFIEKEMEKYSEKMEGKRKKSEDVVIGNKNANSDSFESIKNKGAQTLDMAKGEIIALVNAHFEKINIEWKAMFEFLSLANVQKIQVLTDIQTQVDNLTAMKERFSKGIGTRQGGVTPQVITDYMSGFAKFDFVFKDLDYLIQEMTRNSQMVTSLSLLPQVHIGDKFIGVFTETLKELVSISMTSTKDVHTKYDMSGLKIAVKDFFDGWETPPTNLNISGTSGPNSSFNGSFKKGMSKTQVQEIGGVKKLDTVLNNKFIPLHVKSKEILLHELQSSTLKLLPVSENYVMPSDSQFLFDREHLDNLFIVGGHNFKTVSKKTLVYNIISGQLRVMRDMPAGRWNHRIVQFQNEFYSFGGVEDGKELPTVDIFKYNIDNDSWKTMRPLNIARHSMSCCFFEGNKKPFAGSFVYVFGGFGEDNKMVAEIERYDIENDRSTVVQVRNLSSAPIGGNIFSMQINERQIIILGGSKHVYSEPTLSKSVEYSIKSASQATKIIPIGKEPNKKKKRKPDSFFDYPLPNHSVTVFNAEEDSFRTLGHVRIPYGVICYGSCSLATEGKIYTAGHIVTKSHFENQMELNTTMPGTPEAICLLRIDSNSVGLFDVMNLRKVLKI